MTIFEAVKSMVTPRMAAEHFGLNVSRNGMVCCPFHDDQHPSMKLYEDHYHCFGCQANGDVIAFTSKLFGITPLEAAQKLAADFGIREDRPSVLAKLKMYTTQAENEKLRLKADSAIPSAALYGIYCLWCNDNAYKPLAARTVSMTLKKHADEFGLEHDNHIQNALGKRVNGFWGIEALVAPPVV